MKIKFINHSSFVIEHDGISLISDLWMDGVIFNRSWKLLSPTQFQYKDFEGINYIWFSHEHPDHFFPKNINKIPKKYRNKIIVLFQQTIDKRVLKYCQNAGFKSIIELSKGEYYKLSKDFKILCEPAVEGDSWICYKIGNLTILNTNDCAIRTVNDAYDIKNKVGKVSILLTKFSYASWSGNKNDIGLRRKIAKSKLDLLNLQVQVFKPEITIPIASYFYFCHEENFYLNDSINTAEDVYSFLKNESDTIPIILYPGDEFNPSIAHDCSIALQKYGIDYALVLPNRMLKYTLEKNKRISIDNLYNACSNYCLWMKSQLANNPLLLEFVSEVVIFLSDYKKAFTLSPKDGLTEVNMKYENCDIAISSDSLMFCLKNSYGFETVRIGGRMRKPTNGNFSKFYNFFRVGMLKEKQESFTKNKFKEI